MPLAWNARVHRSTAGTSKSSASVA
ncbi:MAG: hypothetical protein RIQ68_1740, partial [Pseudomonadota bacterium]